MKLNKETLKIIIKEELNAVLIEYTIRPTIPAGISQDNLDKVHGMIDDGDEEYAQQFIDAFDGDPEYAEKFKSAEAIPPEARLQDVEEEYFRWRRSLGGMGGNKKDYEKIVIFLEKLKTLSWK